MPLTQQDRQRCRRYTGRTRINAQVDRTLENALDAVNALEASSPEAYTELVADIHALLTALVDVDAQITEALKKRMKYEKAEDVTFTGAGEIVQLRQQGRTLVQRLCTQLGCPVGVDPFSTAPGALGGMMKHA